MMTPEMMDILTDVEREIWRYQSVASPHPLILTIATERLARRQAEAELAEHHRTRYCPLCNGSGGSDVDDQHFACEMCGGTGTLTEKQAACILYQINWFDNFAADMLPLLDIELDGKTNEGDAVISAVRALQGRLAEARAEVARLTAERDKLGELAKVTCETYDRLVENGRCPAAPLADAIRAFRGDGQQQRRWQAHYITRCDEYVTITPSAIFGKGKEAAES